MERSTVISSSHMILVSRVRTALRERSLRWSLALLCAAGLISRLGAQGPPDPLSGSPERKQEQVTRDASVSGRVLRAGTGTPVPGVSVFLAGPVEQPAPVKTDAQGRYRFDQVARRRYFVIVGGGSGYESVPIVADLRAGQSMTGIDVNVHPLAAVAGRVQDADGHAVANANVLLLRMSSLLGQASRNGTAKTNRLGEFRIASVAAGCYKVLVGMETIQIRAEGSKPGELPEPVTSDVATFYPNSSSLEGGVVLTVLRGQVLEGVDVTLARERTVCVRSEVRDPRAASGFPLRVSVEDEWHLGARPLAQATVANGSRFTACGLPPGTYSLAAFAKEEKASGRFARQEFTAGNRSEDVPGLDLRPLGELRGELKIEKESDPDVSLPAPVAVELLRRGGCGKDDLGSASLDREGPFVLPAACPVKSLLRVRAPRGFYVKSARVETTDVLREHFYPGAGELRIVLGQDAATFTARVSDLDGHPLSGAAVFLWPDPIPARVAPADVQVSFSDPNGQAVFQGVAPGAYRAFALMPESVSLDYPAPEFVASHQSSTERVQLAPREIRTTSIKAIAGSN